MTWCVSRAGEHTSKGRGAAETVGAALRQQPLRHGAGSLQGPAAAIQWTGRPGGRDPKLRAKQTRPGGGPCRLLRQLDSSAHRHDWK